MKRVNLLPPEERRGRRRGAPPATRTTIIGILLILGALSVLLMIGLYLLYYVRLGNEEERAQQLEGEITRQQQRIRELEPYRDLQARLDAKKPIADGIVRTRFLWDEFLRDLAYLIPESTTLDVFVGRATPINIRAEAGGTAEVQNLEPPGSITFNGVALPEYQNISDFIVRMNNLRFLTNAELSRAELDRQTFARPAIIFEVSSDLVTRVGEGGDELLIDEDDVEVTGVDGADEPASRNEQASRPGVER